MGCNCNCLLKDPESKNEMVNGIIPGLGIKFKNKENYEIININTENDDENDNNNNNNNFEGENNDNINVNINDSINIKDQDEDINKDKEDKEDKEIQQINKAISMNEEEGINENNEIYDKVKLTKSQKGLSRNTPRRIITYDSSAISKIQELNESIFDYFKDIRVEPGNFEKMSEEHGVLDIIQKVINASSPCNSLIYNTYYSLLLAQYINNYTSEGEDINQLLEQIEKEEQIKNFNKKLFVIDGDVNDPTEVVWKLIENNKNIAFETFFTSSIESLVISCQMTSKQNFKCYFLFLSKKN